MLTEQQLEEGQKYLRIWRGVTSLPMPAHILNFARSVQEHSLQEFKSSAEYSKLLGVLEMLEYSSDGYIKRYPEEQQVKEALDSLRNSNNDQEVFPPTTQLLTEENLNTIVDLSWKFALAVERHGRLDVDSEEEELRTSLRSLKDTR